MDGLRSVCSAHNRANGYTCRWSPVCFSLLIFMFSRFTGCYSALRAGLLMLGVVLAASGCASWQERLNKQEAYVTAGQAGAEQVADVQRQLEEQSQFTQAQSQGQFPHAAGVPSDGLDMGRWWESLQSPALNQLVDKVVQHNVQLQASQKQLDAQQLQVLIDGAAQQPQVNASLGGAVQNAENPITRRRGTQDSYTSGVNVQWQADVFGRLRYGQQASESVLQAEQWNAVALRHTLISETVRRYIQADFLRKRLQLAQSNVQSRQRSADIIDTRYQKGVRGVSAAQVAASKEAVLQTQSALSTLEQGLHQQAHALSVLQGKLPMSYRVSDVDSVAWTLERQPLAQLPPVRVQAVGVPADLVLRRPDVRAAGQQLQAAQYGALASVAARYPTLGVSAGVTDSGMNLADVLDVKQWVLRLGAEVAQNLWDGGKAKRTAEQKKTQAERVALQYVQTVLTAARETEDALLAERVVGERMALLQERLRVAELSERIQQSRFERGTGDYLALLDSQRSLASAQDALLQAQEAAWLARVNLMMALGGSWTEADAQLVAQAMQQAKEKAKTAQSETIQSFTHTQSDTPQSNAPRTTVDTTEDEEVFSYD